MTEEHLCVVCAIRGRRPVHYERPNVCEQCRVWLAGVLRDIADTYADLIGLDAIHPDRPWTTHQRQQGKWVKAAGYDPASAKLPTGAPGRRPPRFGLITGTRNPEAPINLDLVDLTHRGHRGDASEDAHLWPEDQIGHMAIRARLGSWAQDWLDQPWCRSDRLPEHITTYALAGWLGKRVDDACDHHPAVDEFADEMVAVLAAIRAYVPRVVEDGEQPPSRRAEPRTAPCRGCDMVSLWWWPSDERVRCDNCNVVMTEDEYAVWARLVIAQEKRGAGT